MSDSYTDDELRAYLDEQLPVEKMAAVENDVRTSEMLRQQLSELLQQRESGELTVGEVWRKHRLSCPSRATIGSYLLGVLDEAQADYIRFHLETIGCRYCAATVEELQTGAVTTQPATERRKKFFESSVGRLRNE